MRVTGPRAAAAQASASSAAEAIDVCERIMAFVLREGRPRDAEPARTDLMMRRRVERLPAVDRGDERQQRDRDLHRAVAGASVAVRRLEAHLVHAAVLEDRPLGAQPGRRGADALA